MSVFFFKNFFTVPFILLGILAPLGLSQEADRDTSESEKKCAQNAVYAVSKILGQDANWTLIDEEFGGGEYVSFASIREFFERRGGFCYSAKFQKNSLRRIDFFLATSHHATAVGVIQSADRQNQHYVLVHKIDKDVMYLIDPLNPKFLKIHFSEWPEDMPFDILFVTYDPIVAKGWQSRFRLLTESVTNFCESSLLSVGLFLSVGMLAFPRFVFVKFDWIRHPVVVSFLCCCVCCLLTFAIIRGINSRSELTDTSPLVFDPVEIKLGRQILGKSLEFDFNVKNTSGKTLKVSDSKSSCSCLEFQLSADTILPDNLAKGTGHFKVSQTGESTNYVLITYGTTGQIAWLPVVCEGYEDLKITPKVMNIGCFSSGKGTSRLLEFEMQSPDLHNVADHVELKLSEGIRDLFNVSFVGLESDQDITRLKIAMDNVGTGATKPFVESLSIFLPGDPRKEFVVQLLGEFVASDSH